MKTSQKGIELIKYFEGCKLRAYLDATGIPTIGYGHTLTARMGLTITQEKADFLLNDDLLITENQINKLNLNLNQNQFDALVSFIYNVGIGNFHKSTLLRLVKVDASDFLIAFEFIKWTKAGRSVLPGLETRRKKEAKLYFTGKGVTE